MAVNVARSVSKKAGLFNMRHLSFASTSALSIALSLAIASPAVAQTSGGQPDPASEHQ